MKYLNLLLEVIRNNNNTNNNNRDWDDVTNTNKDYKYLIEIVNFNICNIKSVYYVCLVWMYV